MHTQHQYNCTITWQGNLGTGTSNYTAYGRDYSWQTNNKQNIACSSDTPFRGDGTKHNPEDMLLAALSSCHMLWYLHLCADAGIIVTNYTDKATGVLDMGIGSFAAVTLHPTVTITANGNIELATQLHTAANKSCFMAKSVNFAVQHVVNIIVEA